MAAKDTVEDVPDLVSDSDTNSEDGGDEDQWEDFEEEIDHLAGEVTCLFCEAKQTSTAEVLAHCRKAHDFDLIGLCACWDVHCVAYIKMINYIRKHKPIVEDVSKAISTGQLWASDDYMVAADSSDLMLQFDIESAVSEHRPDKGDHAINGEIPSMTETDAMVALVLRAQRAETERDTVREELSRALRDIETLRARGQQLVLSGESEPRQHRLQSHRTGLQEDDGYFASYSHFGIHQSMLQDKVRTESYRDFMLQNPQVFKDKTVLDVGCGTGILSMFAVRAGASRVVAVDQSNIIYQAMDIARENDLHEKITFVKGRLEDITLPVEKFDVIISEWMGYFLLFEAMLDSVVWARDHCLAPSGWVYPDQFSIELVGVCDPNLQATLVDYWDDVYGFRMSCMKTPIVKEVHVKRIKGDTVASQPACIKKIDVMTATVKDLDFSSQFSLQCLRDCQINALVGYFHTHFTHNCQHKVHFSTGPEATSTHWDQAVMVLPKPITVTKGTSVEGSITYTKHPNDERGIIISLTLGKQKMKYSLS